MDDSVLSWLQHLIQKLIKIFIIITKGWALKAQNIKSTDPQINHGQESQIKTILT